MNEELKKECIKLLQDEQDQLKGAFDPQSGGIEAPKTLGKVSVTQNSDGTYSKTTEEIESVIYDDSVVGIQEAKIKKDAQTLQSLCREIHDRIISFNSQINSKKQEIISLVQESQGRNCWPGIAVSLSNPRNNVSGGPRDFGAPGYILNQDRHVIEIYSSMAGPDVNYSNDNPFEPTRLKTLTSSNSGFGHEILRDNGGLEFNTIEIKRSNYSIAGELDEESAFEDPYLDSFQNTSAVGVARTISNIKSDHEERIILTSPIFKYSGAGGSGIGTDGGAASDQSLTGSAAANRCVEISNTIATLKSEIIDLRAERDALVDLKAFTKIMEKKMEKELQDWGSDALRQKQKDRETSNEAIINIVNNL